MNVFLDTNILVYAHDRTAGQRHVTAKRLASELWQSDARPCISVQVLQELYVNLRRNSEAANQARQVVTQYTAWRVEPNDVELCWPVSELLDGGRSPFGTP